MTRIRRIRQARPLDPGEPHSRLTGEFTEHLAAGVSMVAGPDRPAATTTNSRWRTITLARLLPHTIQLCIHCRQHPAGFWVSRDSDQTVRRPWCLSCCQDLDPVRHHIRPFDLQYLR